MTSPLDDATLAVSQEVRDSMRGWRRRRTEVVVHGVDIAAVRQAAGARAEMRAELGLDRARTKAWALVHAVLDACWDFEDGNTWDRAIAFAEETESF